MTVIATWANRNNALQADVPVDYFAASVTPPTGLKNVLKWYWRASPADPWGEPTIHIVDAPETTDTFNEPGDGFVRLESFTQLGELTCLQPTEWEGYIIGGVVSNPVDRKTESGNRRVKENGEGRTTEY